jgi:hypothetical protein
MTHAPATGVEVILHALLFLLWVKATLMIEPHSRNDRGVVPGVDRVLVKDGDDR